MDTIGTNNSVSNTYKDPSNIDSGFPNVTLRQALITINDDISALQYTAPILVNTSGTTLSTTAYDKIIYFEGDDFTRFDITLPEILSGDSGKKITFVGGDRLRVGRIIPHAGEYVNWLPFIEIGASYSLTLMAYESGVSSNNWVIYATGVVPVIWEFTQATQTIASGGSPTILNLSTNVFAPYSGWSGSHTALGYAPGYYQITCQVTMTAATSLSAVLLYAFRGGVQNGDALQKTIVAGTTETLTYVYYGYFNGLSTDDLDFRIMQTTAGSLSQDVIYASVKGNFVMLGS